MADDNLKLENKYAGLISERALALLKKRRRQLMARHHSIKAKEFRRDGKLFHYAAHHIRHPELIGLKLVIWKLRLASLFQSGHS